MAKFNFLLVGSPCVHRLEVAARDLDAVTADVVTTRFMHGELDPDDCGQIRRMAIRSDRIQVVVEAD